MRAWIFSDLHLPRLGFVRPPPPPIADLALVAGDICEGSERAIGWLEEHIRPHMQVVYTLGNHEFYHSSIRQELSIARRAARRAGIHLLEQDTVQVGDTNFIGATLWTDYRLYSQGDERKRTEYMAAARRGLMDHHLIYRTEYSSELFDPVDALGIHTASRTWLNSRLAQLAGGKTVVVSHHAPHARSVAARWNGHILTPAFVSDLGPLIEQWQPRLWVHGHTHSSFDFIVGATRVVCNPLGYSAENETGFRWDLVVEI